MMELTDHGIPALCQANIDELAQLLCFNATNDWGHEIVHLRGPDLHPQRLGPTGSLKGPMWKSYQHKAMCQLVAFRELAEAMGRF